MGCTPCYTTNLLAMQGICAASPPTQDTHQMCHDNCLLARMFCMGNPDILDYGVSHDQLESTGALFLACALVGVWPNGFPDPPNCATCTSDPDQSTKNKPVAKATAALKHTLGLDVPDSVIHLGAAGVAVIVVTLCYCACCKKNKNKSLDGGMNQTLIDPRMSSFEAGEMGRSTMEMQSMRQGETSVHSRDIE